MTSEEILSKAIIKAMRGGWSTLGLHVDLSKKTDEDLLPLAKHIAVDTRSSIIFSHDFAKAFFNRDCEVNCECHKRHGILREEHSPFESCCKCADWQYHLQIMVLEEDPIKYLERFL